MATKHVQIETPKFGAKVPATFGDDGRHVPNDLDWIATYQNVIASWYADCGPTQAGDSFYTVTMGDQRKFFISVVFDTNVASRWTTYPNWSGAMATCRHARRKWMTIASSGTTSLSVDMIGQLIASITEHLNEGGFAEVDNYLLGACFKKMSLDAVIAVARMTFPAKAHLANWAGFVARARAAMEERGEAGPILKGLG